MRISDWSSDVCSSDLEEAPVAKRDIGDHHRAIMKGAIGLPMAVGQVADDGAVDPAARCHDDRPRAYLAQLSVAGIGHQHMLGVGGAADRKSTRLNSSP